ncbi:MAG TPA: ferredoxin-type protein NapG [Nitrospirae bacterium]|nr:quinol dehydrogenase periplasmic component [bacterium BMS3Abin06]HDH13491.1 ferredoxin-type protein NapG [Nitrospirota bacterium]HDZ01069.1 ferredoxin-type protein NapG [Nitrospirota bacterium]
MSDAEKIDSEERVSRRSILRSATGTVSGGLLMYILFGMLGRGKNFLKPPGAAEDEVFNSLCIRCGKCAKSCPYDAVKIADIDEGTAIGTPYIIAREIPCYLCEDFPCISSCPTNALDHTVILREQVKMGTAIVTDRESCLSLNGIRCEVCYRVCPLIDKAITLETYRNPRTGRHAIFEPVVHRDQCVGCGQCEYKCVLDRPAIKVLPTKVIAGKVGKHYIFGWK